MKKKVISAVLCTTMAVAMLAGCGSNGGAKSNSISKATSAASSAAESTSAKSKSTEPAKAEGGKNLVYWSMWNETEPQAEVIKDAIEEYQTESGNTVTVEWKGRDISTIIQAALDAGETIDLFDEDYQRVGQQYASKCMDLEDMAKAADYETHSVEALPTALRGWAGSLKGIAYQPYTSGIFYNKAMFKEAGIEKEPATWTEFLDACKKLKDAGYAPLVQDDAYVLYSYGFQIARHLGQDGVVDLCKNGGWAESEGALAAAKEIQSLVESGYYSEYAPDAYPNNENEIGYENAAMIVNASWVPSEITNNTKCDIEWGMFNYPTVDGGKDPATVANVGAQAFAIPDNSKNGQAAFDLIMKITTGAFDQKMALDTQSIPADPTNEEWPEMIAGCKDAFNALTNVYDWNMGLNTDADLKTVIQDNLMKLFEGKMTAEEFIAAVDAASK